MQRYTIIPEGWSLAESLPFINDNYITLLSNNSGTAFPQLEIYTGMICYREDLMKAFVLIDKEYSVWYMFLDFTKIPVTKDYVDNIVVPIERLSGLFDEATRKIKLNLLNTGVLNGQLVALNSLNKIETKLIDTGTKKGQIVILDENAKMSMLNLPTGTTADSLVKLDGKGKLLDIVIPDNIARFNAQGRLVFPNGNQFIVEG